MREAPIDKEAERVYEQIGNMARDACLVVESYGGIMLVMTPLAQRRAHLRDKALQMHNAKEREEHSHDIILGSER